MNISGILVHLRPEALKEGMRLLQALPGVEVHHFEKHGRVVVTQEAAAISDEVAGLGSIRRLDGVVSAEMVYHRFDEEPTIEAALAARKSGQEVSDSVLNRLNA